MPRGMSGTLLWTSHVLLGSLYARTTCMNPQKLSFEQTFLLALSQHSRLFSVSIAHECSASIIWDISGGHKTHFIGHFCFGSTCSAVVKGTRYSHQKPEFWFGNAWKLDCDEAVKIRRCSLNAGKKTYMRVQLMLRACHGGPIRRKDIALKGFEPPSGVLATPVTSTTSQW